jgi:hypothetical protein
MRIEGDSFGFYFWIRQRRLLTIWGGRGLSSSSINRGCPFAGVAVVGLADCFRGTTVTPEESEPGGDVI